MNLDHLRKEIDRIDEQLVNLLNERAGVAFHIGQEKRKGDKPVRNQAREDAVVAHAQDLSHGPLTRISIENIYRQIINACSQVQENTPKNTFADIANPWVAKLICYEPGRPVEEVARELGFKSADDIVKLASNESALGPSPRAIKAMQDAAGEMHRYPDGNAYYLRQAISAKLNIPMDLILPTHGSNEALELLGHAFLSNGTSIVMADKAFIVYKLVADMFQAQAIMVPMKKLTHDPDAMLAAIRPDTKIVYLSNPNNPTSTMIDQAALDRFMDAVPGHVIVCFDEAYIELLPPTMQPDTIQYVRAGRNAIILRTFSKTYGLAGLRLGYALAPKECLDLLNRVRQPFNVNAMAMAGAMAALQDDDYVQKVRTLIREELDFYERELDRLGVPFVPAVANFLLADVGKGRDIFVALQKEGVIVRPMDGYKLPEYIRITVGTREENIRCIRALQKVLGK
jgi:histidinol-phosphate aminotransferase